MNTIKDLMDSYCTGPYEFSAEMIQESMNGGDNTTNGGDNTTNDGDNNTTLDTIRHQLEKLAIFFSLIPENIPKPKNSKPQRSEFNSAVRRFNEKHNVKLKDLFKKDKMDENKNRTLRGKFWRFDPVIRSYFSREFKEVDFTSKLHPDFNINRENKMLNDYYEWRIYELAKEHEVSFLPFRMHSRSDDFYTKGVEVQLNPVEYLMTKDYKTDDIKITKGCDIYRIRERLTRVQFDPDNTCRFILSPDYKDSHATTLFSILERGSNRILATIMINSWDKEEYFNYIKSRFELQGSEKTNNISSYYKRTSFSNKLYDEIKEQAQDGYYFDKENNTGYIIDFEVEPFFLPDSLKEIVNPFENDEEDNDIKVLHNLYKRKDGTLIHTVKDHRNVPFLDASHNLQIGKNDGNCVLYTNHMIQAIATFLGNNEIADEIYQLALTINDGSDEEKTEAEARLVKFFKQDIKPYLPFYYNEDGSAKSAEELMEFHLRKRWEVASMAANSSNYLRKVGFLPEEVDS